MEFIQKNEKYFIILGVLIALIFELSFLVSAFLPKALAKEIESDDILEEIIIYREPIFVNDMYNLLNDMFLQNNLKTINLDYLSIKDETYYVGLYQDIILFISPITLNNTMEDIVYQMGIIYDNESLNYELALSYYECILKVNNEFIYDYDALIKDVLIKENSLVDQNNGLLLSKIVNEYETNLVLERKYKKDIN